MKRRRNSMTTKALLALQEQVNLVTFWGGDYGIRFGKGWTNSRTKKEAAAGVNRLAPWLGGDFDQRAAVLGDNIATFERAKLNRATTYWVTSDLQAMMVYAASKMESQPLHATDMPSPNGFIWFEDKVVERDSRNMPVSWRVITWSLIAGGTGVHLAYYTDILNHADGEFPDEYPLRDGRKHYFDKSEWLRDGNPRLVLAHDHMWYFGHGYTGAFVEDSDRDLYFEPDEAEEVLKQVEFWGRNFIAAMWAIMLQKVSAKTPQHIPASYRPVAQRLEIPAEVIFVDLRKVVRPKQKNDPDFEPRMVEWNHRWVVDGFWRNQWYPSLGMHRQIWIDDYVKGPEDRPLIVKDRVNRVVR